MVVLQVMVLVDQFKLHIVDEKRERQYLAMKLILQEDIMSVIHKVYQ